MACGPAPLEPRDPDPGSFHFTVETFNVEVWHSDDEATVAAVGREDADIVCLQETGAEWEAVLRERYADQYPYMAFHSTLESGAIGAMSKFPIEDLGLVESPNDWHPAWLLRVSTEKGPIQILNLHLRAILNGRSSGAEAYLTVDDDHSNQIRVFSAGLDWSAPTLALGDFNEDTSGAAVKWLEDRGFENILWLYHPGQPTWQGKSVGGQFSHAIDHVLYGPSLVPLNAWVSGCGVSDHMPVSAHLEFAPAK